MVLVIHSVTQILLLERRNEERKKEGQDEEQPNKPLVPWTSQWVSLVVAPVQRQPGAPGSRRWQRRAASGGSCPGRPILATSTQRGG